MVSSLATTALAVALALPILVVLALVFVLVLVLVAPLILAAPAAVVPLCQSVHILCIGYRCSNPCRVGEAAEWDETSAGSGSIDARAIGVA